MRPPSRSRSKNKLGIVGGIGGNSRKRRNLREGDDEDDDGQE